MKLMIVMAAFIAGGYIALTNPNVAVYILMAVESLKELISQLGLFEQSKNL